MVANMRQKQDKVRLGNPDYEDRLQRMGSRWLEMIPSTQDTECSLQMTHFTT